MEKRYIYILEFPDGKAYIGQTMDFKQRMWSHSNTKRKLPVEKAVYKYGWGNVKRRILFVCDTSTGDFFERRTIAVYDTLLPNGYNVQLGGNSGRQTSEETRQRLAMSNLRRPPRKKRVRAHVKKEGVCMNEYKRKTFELLGELNRLICSYCGGEIGQVEDLSLSRDKIRHKLCSCIEDKKKMKGVCNSVHGTDSRYHYRRGCRCPLCKDAHNRKAREYRRKVASVK